MLAFATCDSFLDCSRLKEIICVQECKPISSRLAPTSLTSRSFASVTLMKNADSWVFGSLSLKNAESIIGRPIIDADYLDVSDRLIASTHKRIGNIACSVIAGDDDGRLWQRYRLRLVKDRG